MSIDIKGKVALISGGASGIGFCYAKELLRNGLKGVTIADINENFGKSALEEIEREFGPNKAIYVKTDVSNKENYEEAFIQTIEVFKNLDILVNNAGIANDSIWEREIEINFIGVVHGVLLGLENYIPKYKTGNEGVIVNISSIAGVEPFSGTPIYTAIKFGIIGMSKAFGDAAHYKRTNVKVLTLCPGLTVTNLVTELSGKNVLGPPYQELMESGLAPLPSQGPESVAKAMVEIIKNAKSGTVWIAEGGQNPYEYIIPPRETFAPK